MGTKSLKPRHIVSAMHLQEILEEMYRVLSDFEALSLSEYSDYSLCLSHFGKIEIQHNTKLNAVYSWGLRHFYHILLDAETQTIVTNKFINYKTCIEFTNQMICESMYDWEYSAECSYGDAWPIEERCAHWLNDNKHANEVIEGYKWIGDYWKIAHNDFVDLWNIIQNETDISGIHLSFLKEYLLENIYGIKGYMPKRYDEYRYDYARIFSEQINDEKIDRLIDEGLKLQKNLTYYVGKAMPEINLFTESKVQDIVKHIINVFVSYHYYELGKCIILKSDMN